MKKRIDLILLICWMIVIFVMSSFSAYESGRQSGFIVDILSKVFNLDNIELINFFVRKTAHFLEYFILGIFCYNVIRNRNYKLFTAVIISFLYACSDEVHQMFSVGRSCKFLDIIIDSCGAVFGIYLWKYIKSKNNN